MTNHRLLMTVLLAASACGGSWSNRDLEFASALPSREALRSKLPTTSSSSSPLTQRDGLNVGEPSKAYADAKSAATTFNGVLDFLLTVLDQVRAITPTTRTDDSRTWGPYTDGNNPGFQFSVTIRQASADTFEWSMRSNNPTTGQTVTIVEGMYLASATAKRGQGQMRVTVSQFRDVLKVDDNFKQLDEIIVGYMTDRDPMQVAMSFAFKPGASSGISAIGYTYLERADKSGAMTWAVRSTSPQTTVLQMTAGWTTKGDGRAHSVVMEGLYKGASLDECWDTSFAVTLYAEGWPSGQTNGSVASCPMIEGF